MAPWLFTRCSPWFSVTTLHGVRRSAALAELLGDFTPHLRYRYEKHTRLPHIQHQAQYKVTHTHTHMGSVFAFMGACMLVVLRQGCESHTYICKCCLAGPLVHLIVIKATCSVFFFLPFKPSAAPLGRYLLSCQHCIKISTIVFTLKLNL